MIFDPEQTRGKSLAEALRHLGCATFGHSPVLYAWSPHVLSCRRCYATLGFGGELTDDWPQSMRDSYLGGRRALKWEREANRAASADTHPKGGDVQQAPLVSGAVPKADAQNQFPTERTGAANNRSGETQ